MRLQPTHGCGDSPTVAVAIRAPVAGHDGGVSGSVVFAVVLAVLAVAAVGLVVVGLARTRRGGTMTSHRPGRLVGMSTP